MKKEKSLGVTFTGAITVNGPMFDIHDNEHVHIGNPIEADASKDSNSPKETKAERDEEQFHFVHPEVDDDEAWHIHNTVKRLVAHHKASDICRYLKELGDKEKILLPQSPKVAYQELIRMGMPTGEGYGEKYFSSCYMK